MVVIGDLSAPAATLGVMGWSGGSDEIPLMKRILDALNSILAAVD
ncbi:hypothetical protein [Arthrobacter sp. Y81]|nr:hypothetical protein [Arthrobacter sp. Y81]